jgi:hypothetical protein
MIVSTWGRTGCFTCNVICQKCPWNSIKAYQLYSRWVTFIYQDYTMDSLHSSRETDGGTTSAASTRWWTDVSAQQRSHGGRTDGDGTKRTRGFTLCWIGLLCRSCLTVSTRTSTAGLSAQDRAVWWNDRVETTGDGRRVRGPYVGVRTPGRGHHAYWSYRSLARPARAQRWLCTSQDSSSAASACMITVR